MSPPSGSIHGDNHHGGVVDPRIWRACAGASVHIPLLNSRVYYFPQGHVEHCCPLSPLIYNPPPYTSSVHCTISSVQLLVDPITDEVFAHLFLKPELNIPTKFPIFRGYKGAVANDNNRVTTFAKILTPSDANNGGGFTVPRLCALSIFPPLNFQEDPNTPVQNLSITDIHGGTVWEFRHIYRGKPRRHLLTTGWTQFVNSKKLIGGDSVVFMKTSAGELFIGVRRAPVSSSDGGDEYNGYYNQRSGGVAERDEGSASKQFRRTGNGRLTDRAVSKAMLKASWGLPFEVVYYPTAGWSDFVVRAEDVESSLSMPRTPGTRVKMALKPDDPLQGTSIQGTVSSIYQENGPWRGSCWKQLQITWDEPQVLQNVKRVNPWQVEIVANAPQPYATFPPALMLKYPQTGWLFERGESRTTTDPSRYVFSHSTFPAGMQGARHVEFGSYNPTRFIGDKPLEFDFFSPRPRLEEVSTEMNIGSLSSDDLSLTINRTNVTSGSDLDGNRGPMSAKAKPIMLFGEVLTMQEPSESDLAESGLCEEDSSEKSSDNETHFIDFFAYKDPNPK